MQAGIDELMVVTGGTHAGEFFRLLGNGEAYGIDRLAYGYQERAGGIAEALGLAERFVDRDKCCVLLADNVFERTLRPVAENFAAQERGARVVLARVEEEEHLRHLGVAELDGGRVTRDRREAAGAGEPVRRHGRRTSTTRASGRCCRRSGRPAAASSRSRTSTTGTSRSGRSNRTCRGILGRRRRVDRRLLRRERLRPRNPVNRDRGPAPAAADAARRRSRLVRRARARERPAEADPPGQPLALARRRDPRPPLPRARPGRRLRLPAGMVRVVVLDRSSGETWSEDIGDDNPVAVYVPGIHAHGYEALTDCALRLPRHRGVRPRRPGRAGVPWDDERVCTCGARHRRSSRPRVRPGNRRRRPARRRPRRGVRRRRCVALTRGELGRDAAAAGRPPQLDLVLHAAALDRRRRRRGGPAGSRGRVNVGGTQHAAELGAPLVAFSTDYVFDGAKREPYASPTRRTRSRPTAARSCSARRRRARTPGSSARRGCTAGPARTSSGRCSASAPNGTRSPSSTTSAAARPTSAISRRRSRARRAAVRRLAPRRRGRVHVGRVRRGDLRGGRSRVPRPPDHGRRARPAGAAARLLGAAKRAPRGACAAALARGAARVPRPARPLAGRLSGDGQSSVSDPPTGARPSWGTRPSRDLLPDRDVGSALARERLALPPAPALAQPQAGDPRHQVELGRPDVAERNRAGGPRAVAKPPVVRDEALRDDVDSSKPRWSAPRANVRTVSPGGSR